ncbi:hypothetical protein ASG90_10040 [Nocardioides sp. Soil797]|nr:hypothetical protein ASG90_10040 [Nocardioides sp. Soil797]
MVLHIGPHKTGTTTLQGAVHVGREALAAQGVLYAGQKAHSMTAAMVAATGKRLSTQEAGAGAKEWSDIVEQVRASDARHVLVSSEFFADASKARISEIVDALGADRTHVVVTLRPLVRIVASQWQQYLQNRPAVHYDDKLEYADWLREMLDRPKGRRITPTFWSRHDHAKLVERWAEVVGHDRMTIVVVDDSDRESLLRSFEGLLGLADGTLAPREHGSNRSLSLPEISLLNAFNKRYVASDHSLADYTNLVRFGAVRFLQKRTPAPDEPRLLTPQWAVDRFSEVGAASADAIAATGIRVVGDLSLLGDPTVASNVGESSPIDEVPTELTARFLVGMVKAAVEAGAADARRKLGSEDGEEEVRRDKLLQHLIRRSDGDLDAALARVRQELGAARSSAGRAEGGPSPDHRAVDDLTRGEALRMLAHRAGRRLRLPGRRPPSGAQ